MASKLGKALGFSMDLGETPKEKKLGMNSSDIDSTTGGSGKTPAEDQIPQSENGEEVMDDEGSEKSGDASAETLAMKMFEKASTTEAKVSAFRSLLEACGVTGGSY